MSTLTSKPAAHSVVIVPYDPNWQILAAREAGRLIDTLGSNILSVEHFGSTSVAGLAAKPVIDLMPIVGSLQLLDDSRSSIQALGYEWHGEFGIAGRRFCTLSDEAGMRLVHLHFYQSDSAQIERHLAFRDYLRAHPAVAREYEKEKRRAANLHPFDSLAYNNEKWPWMAQTESQALAWFTVRQAT